ncbi:MAG: TrkH family potassium uptake protein [Planctomycetes bacterium]|nr:TrkH family potassium uptake protein [Planctomycetota bacterium]
MVVFELCFIAYPGTDHRAFFEAACVDASLGLLCWLPTRRHHLRVSPNDALLIVMLTWVVMCVVGSLPYLFYRGQHILFCDALFESVSGFSTTGASILTDIESLPHPLLLWRSFTHWIGGIGIVVMFLAVLPILRAGGSQLFRAEIPGPSKDKFTPTIGKTARAIFSVYCLITLAEVMFLMFFGMNLFDALCHAFGTVATGGFSNRNLSVAYYHSPAIEMVIAFFMFISGANFSLHLSLMHGDWRSYLRNSEFRLYCFIIFCATLLLTLVNMYQGHFPVPPGPGKAFREALFQVVSLMTCTGFASADFDAWPELCRFTLLALMFVGACSGSTGGGLKVFSVLVAFKACLREMRSIIWPRGVFHVRMDGMALGEHLVRATLAYIFLFLAVFLFSSLILVGLEGGNFPFLDLLSIDVSCLSGVGPGLGAFGPTLSYALLSPASKYLLCFVMLLGRVEIYTFLILFAKPVLLR